MSDHDRTPAPASTPGEGTRQEGCIVARLRAEVAWEPEVGVLMDEAADEIERLRLTDAEREALHWFAHYGLPEHRAATLRGLLERTR